MPILKLRDGTTADVQEGDLLNSLDDERYQGAQVAVAKVGDKGEIVNRGMMPFDRMSLGTMEPGVAFLPSENYQQWQKEAELKERYKDSEFKAAALGVARALSFGLSDYLLTWDFFDKPVMTKEEIRAIKDENPIPSGVGEGIGIVGPAIISGGTSLLAKGAAKLPTAILTRSAEAATSKIASSVGKKVAKEALEGSVYGATAAADEAFLNDREMMKEALVGGLLGTAMGGALPASIAGGKALGKAVSGKISKAMTLGDATLGLASTLTGAPKEVLEQALTSKAEGQVTRRIVDEFDDLSQKKAMSFAERLTTLHQEGQAGLEYSRGFKAEQVSQILRDEAQVAGKKGRTLSWDRQKKTYDVAKKKLEELSQKLAIMDEQGIGSYGSPAQVKQLRYEVNKSLRALDKAYETGLETFGTAELLSTAFVTLDRIKKDAGRMAANFHINPNEFATSPEMLSNATNTALAFESIFQDLRGMLQNKKLFGKSLTDMQTEINLAWTDYLGAAKAKMNTRLFQQAPKNADEIYSDAYDRAIRHGYDQKEADDIARKAIDFERPLEAKWDSAEKLVKSQNELGTQQDLRNMKLLVERRNELLKVHRKHFFMDPEDLKKVRRAIEAGDEILGEFDKTRSKPISETIAMAIGERYAGVPVSQIQEQSLRNMLINQAGIGANSVIDLTNPKVVSAISDAVEEFSSAGKRIPTEILDMVAERTPAHAYASAQKIAGEIKKRSNVDLGITLGLTGFGAGAVLGGPVAAAGLGLVGLAYNKLRNPKAFMTLKTIIERQKTAIGSTYRYLDSIQKYAGRVGVMRPVISASSRGLVDDPAEVDKIADLADRKDEVLSELRELDVPDQYVDQVSQMIDRLSGSLPSRMPVSSLQAANGEQGKFNPAEKKEWDRDIGPLVTDPGNIFRFMESGRLKGSQVKFLRDNYPSTYSAFALQLQEYLRQVPSLKGMSAVQSSRFLGLPVVTPVDINAYGPLQGVYASQGQRERRQPPQRKSVMSEGMNSKADRIESR